MAESFGASAEEGAHEKMRGSGLLYANDLIRRPATSAHLLSEQGSVSRADGIIIARAKRERVEFLGGPDQL